MGGKSSAPTPPNPQQTASAQWSLNHTNQNTPFASLNYTQNGTDSSGNPIMTGTTTLSPQLQSLYDQVGKSSAAANSALDPANLKDQFNQQQGAAYNNQMNYLHPQQEQQTGQLKDQLAQQGITQESNPTAYANAMSLNNNNQTFQNQQAYNSSYQNGLAGQNQAYNQAVGLSNLPIQQLTSLMNGSNLQSPSNSNDLVNMMNSQYQSQLGSYNNQQSGLFGLGGSGLMAYALGLKG